MRTSVREEKLIKDDDIINWNLLIIINCKYQKFTKIIS